MNKLKLTIVFAALLVFASCGKKDEKVNTENQSSTQNVSPESKTNTQTPADVLNKWVGKYSFEESAKNVTGDGAQTWNYVIDVKAKEDKSLIAEIQVDGFQTMTRLEAEVKPSDKSADFVFSKYMPENMFEIYKKGDKLFTLQLNDKGDIVTNWDKMKPNVLDNQKSGKVMIKKIAS
jgi:hypothetical protein